ncbi:MAG: thioredoxin family protein [Ignavibacteriae bacterium]|nr:thioredoxin family protein [Ignavibacteriota bacterium]
MELTLVTSINCSACLRAETILKNLQSNYENIFLSIVDAKKFNNNKIQITPALLIDNKLFSYGEIEQKKLLLKVNSFSH